MSALDHGKESTYNYYGCRCDECRRAKRDAQRRRRGSVSWAEYREREASRETRTEHGTIGRWWRHGCRCEVCTKANSERVRVWRASKRRVAT